MGNIVELANKQTSLQVVDNPWQRLRGYTSARIALGRSGNSIPTNELLAFQLDHAQAMDAVHCALDIDVLVSQLTKMSGAHLPACAEPIVLESKVPDRLTYLQRPDLGRQLDEGSWQALENLAAERHSEPDLAIVIADGLSSTAIQHHAVPVVGRLLSMLQSDTEQRWELAPISIVKQGRVAVADDVAQCLNANMVLILIGERPGLTSPDSMGMYLTWGAKRGSKDAHRNCISNVRPGGLGYDDACQRAVYLLNDARKLQLSGVNLKDRSTIDEQRHQQVEDACSDNFLIPQL